MNVSKWNMQDICDINDKLGDDMILYRLNRDKTLSWLKEKIGLVNDYFHFVLNDVIVKAVLVNIFTNTEN